MQPPAPGSKRTNKQQITYGKKRRRVPESTPFSFRLPPSPQLKAMFTPSSDQTDFSQKPPAIPPRPAPAPRSQKEATMATEVTQEQVDFLEAMGIDAATARRWLKVKKNDANAAASAIFDGEDIAQLETSETWDETAWSADREGGNSAGDGTGHQLNALGAPTAPPSRASTPNRQHLAPNSQQEADADMRAAIEASMQNSTSNLSALDFQQETGTVGKDGVETKSTGLGTFGPATRKEYSESQWGMVPHSQSTSEIVPDVLDVEKRRNIAGEPRFVKPLASVDGDYLPSLLTICHAIAGAREALLMRSDVKATYGEDADWWKGHAIALPRIVHTESGQPVDPEAEDYDALIAEVQRLIAFLDQGERSYASAAPLAQNGVLKGMAISNSPSKTLLETFMAQWGMAASGAKSNSGDESTMFCTTFSKNNSDGMVAEDESISLIDLETRATKDERTDLTALLDKLIWGDGVYDNPPFSVESPAEVLVMRLRQTETKEEASNVEVPQEFFLDKYLTKNEEVLGPVRREMAKSRMRIGKLSEAERNLKTWKHPKKNEYLDARELLKCTHSVFAGSKKTGDDEESALPNGVPAPETPPHYHAIAEKLERVMASIDDKLEKLASEKEKAKKAITEMSRNPLPEAGARLGNYRYILRGVATKPNTTYVLLPKADEDEVMLIDTNAPITIDDDEDEDDDGTPAGMQWWRIEYRINSTGTGAMVDKTKTPLYDVSRAVELEHKSALLVYASDRMNNIENYNPVLPAALQQFVDRDNELFRAELEEAKLHAAPPAYQFDDAMAETDMQNVMPSIEDMRGRRDSADSMNVQRDLLDVDGAGEDHGMPTPPGYEQDGFEGHQGFGLPPAKQGRFEREEEVHEIVLDDEGEEMEMAEKAHQPLIPGFAGGGSGGDSAMRDVGESQDAGMGGAAHVEDAKME